MRLFAIVHRTLLSAIVVAASVQGAGAATSSAGALPGEQAIPNGAIGYVHARVSQLAESPNLSLFKRLLGHIEHEVSQCSLSRLGINLTTLSDVVVVLPSFEKFSRLSAAGDAPFVVVATFDAGYSTEDASARIRDQLRFKQGDDGLLTHRDGTTIYIASDTTLALGAKTAVNWWRAAHETQGSSDLIDALHATMDEGHVRAAVNVAELVEALGGDSLPIPLPIAKAELLTVALGCDDDLSLKVNVRFQDDSAASQSNAQLQGYLKQGRALLSIAEVQMQQRLNEPDASLDECFQALGALALIREGAGYLDDVQLVQEENWVRGAARVHNDATSIVMVCLTAVNAIGTQAERQFESVVEELQ